MNYHFPSLERRKKLKDAQEKILEWMFGKTSAGNTMLKRAMTSTRLFVRSQDHLTLHKPGATGLVMSAFDVFTNFGTEIIEEVLNKGSAIIVAGTNEPAASIINLRKKKKMSQKQLAQKAELSLEQIRDAEDKNTRTSMFVLCKICLALDIDPKKISWQTFS